MSFTSLGYIIFLIITAFLCYKLKLKGRNVLLLLANYGFYTLYGTEHLPFLLGSTLFTFFAAKLIAASEGKKRKSYLIAALVINLGLLFVFKYLGFSVQILQRALSTFGIDASLSLPELILPAGISFFVFQTTGYLMDVYRKKQPPEKNFIDYALFASFFPALISGPIQRAGDMLPQYKKKQPFSYENVKDGALQFVWGTFKKMVIADPLAVFVNTVYAQSEGFSGFQLAAAAVFYSIQIYCDFSAYSDMAIGSAKVMGISLPKNFDNPYFSASMQEFWRRWHISLSTWFRDYLYIPLGGNRKGKWRLYLNIIIVFFVSGLWHGAASTFIVWGLLHGLYQVIGKMTEKYRDKLKKTLGVSEESKLLHAFRVAFTFILVTLAWVFFRAASVSQALSILGGIFTFPWSLASIAELGISKAQLILLCVFVITLFVSEWLQGRFSLAKGINKSYAPRAAVYFILIAAIMLFGHYGAGFDPMDFVYFKF